MPYCEYCGREVSDEAITCPNCGHPRARAPVPAVHVPQGVEPVSVGDYAGFGRRFVALLIDGILLSPLTFFISWGSSGAYDRAFQNRPYGLLISFAYHWLMIAFNGGRTVGKLAMGIRITRPDGSPVDPGRAAARAGMAIVSGFAIGLGYLWAAFDREHRTWHDSVADTRAYRVPRV